MEIIPISDGELHVPATELLSRPVEDPAFLDADGLLPVNFGGFLVCTDDHLVVIDTGIGPGALPELSIGSLPDNLRKAGVQPEDVDHVIFTHLHFDHVGWATDGTTPLFPNAEHHCSAVDWDWFCGPEPTVENGPGMDDFGAIPAPERLAPLANRMRTFGAEAEIVPGVRVRHAPGHTPGHSIVLLGDDDDLRVLLGDVAHTPAALLTDDFTSPTDTDPELARRTRAEIAEWLIDTGAAFTMTHHVGNPFGRLTSIDGARTWSPVAIGEPA